MNIAKATIARQNAWSYFFIKTAEWWIYDKQGNRLNKKSIFECLYVEPKDHKEPYTPAHQVALDLTISRMNYNFDYKERKDVDPDYISPSLNQESLEHETVKKVIDKVAISFLRQIEVGNLFFKTPKLKNTLETAMLNVYQNYEQISREVKTTKVQIS